MKNRPQYWVRAALLCGSVFLLGWVDWQTGHDLNFFVFYFFPVSVVAWLLGFPMAIAISLLCAGVWYAANDLGGRYANQTFYAFWNTGIRLTSFLYIGFAISQMHHWLIREERASAALRDALSEIKVLHGILPVCAQCKKIRNDDGAWEQMEAYISQRSDTQFTHGYCPECVTRLREEAGLPSKEGGDSSWARE